MPELVSMGEMLIDLFDLGFSQSGTRLFEANAGGAPANVAVGAARLGLDALFMGKLSTDPLSEILIDTLNKENVKIADIQRNKIDKTAMMLVSLGKNGQRKFSCYRQDAADLTIEPDDIDDSVIRKAKIFHFGSLLMCQEPAKSATLKAVRLAFDNKKLISFDPNIRPGLFKGDCDAKTSIDMVLPWVDILKLSKEEQFVLTGKSSAQEGMQKLWEQNRIRLIFTTLGKRGCQWLYKGKFGSYDGYKADAIDTTGAGDGFLAAILYYIARVLDCDINNLTDDDITDMLKLACAAGAITTIKQGAINALPTKKEIEKFIYEHNTFKN